MMIGSTLLFILILVVAYKLIQRKDQDDIEQSPREILDQRYAKGEIEHDEYERAKRDLSN